MSVDPGSDDHLDALGPDGSPPQREVTLAKSVESPSDVKADVRQAVFRTYGVILTLIGAFSAIEPFIREWVKGAAAAALVAVSALVIILAAVALLFKLRSQLKKLDTRVLWNSAGWLVALGLLGALIVGGIFGLAGRALSAPPHQAALRALAAPSSGTLSSVDYSFDDKFLAAGDGNGHVYVWQVSDDRLVASMPDPDSKGVNSVAFNPANSLIAAGDANGHIYLWAHKLAGTLTDPSSKGVRSVVFSADNKALVVGDGNGHVYVWHTRTNTISETLTDSGSKGVNCVAFDSATTTIAAGDGNGSVYLWLYRVTGAFADPASAGVRSVAFSPDDKYFAAADGNGKIYLRQLD